MSALRNCLKRRRRAYADAADVPWDLEDVECRASKGTLFRYLRGGGSRAFGVTTGQMRASLRQTRFLVFFAALVAVWLVFFFM